MARRTAIAVWRTLALVGVLHGCAEREVIVHRSSRTADDRGGAHHPGDGGTHRRDDRAEPTVHQVTIP